MFHKSKPTRLRRGSAAYKKLQIDVLDRDAFFCQQCFKHTTAPPHHIQKVSQGGSDVIENMVTLCVKCHDRYPNWKERV